MSEGNSQRWNGDKRGLVRMGKTAIERKAGLSHRRRDNQLARNAWLEANRGTGGQEKQAFPVHTLGGKGNSSNPWKMRGGKGRVKSR